MKKRPKRPRLNNPLFSALYTLVTGGALLLASPVLLALTWKRKYRQALPARFFLWRNPPLPSERIWFHACSFGETRALGPLLERFDEAVLTVTTRTGWQEGQKRLPGRVRYLPFEPWLWLWVRPQKALVVMEAELWYLLFLVARRRGARTILLNARISDRSWPAYRRFAPLYRRLFAEVDRVFAQSEKDRKRLEALGAKRVEVIGNIKLANLPAATASYPRPEGTVVTAASTHEGEEAGIFQAFAAWRRRHGKQARLIVVPRHPERFDKVARLLASLAEQEGLRFTRWSETGRIAGDVLLVDAMGELVNFYALSDIVVLGGAFVPGVGGHNPAEVIPFGCALVSGLEIFNQQAMFDAVEGAIFSPLEELDKALDEAEKAPPLRLKHPVSLEPVIEELQRVV